MMPAEFRLKVTRFETICQFELAWGESQSITVLHSYPAQLDQLYQNWQQVYLNFYQTWLPVQRSIQAPTQAPIQALRAYVAKSGSIDPKIDWKTQLKEAEAALLQAFRDWLAEGALRDIRQELTDAARGSEPGLNVYLTCEPDDLVRLPWENWQISDDRAVLGKIRVVRAPSRIRSSPVPQRARWKRARILAIFCDDWGLDLSQEKQILKSLEPLVSVQMIDGSDSVSKSARDLRQSILTAITDPAGWDMLFFAGHSDETKATRGMVAIAPNEYITIEDLTPSLTTAKNQGLQLAIFNSCSGLQIAAALIDLGLNEVIVMRERIHSRVAQAFLVQFASGLKEYKTAHGAMLEAVTSLDRLEYPSAYLVPSLFQRPGTASFLLSPPSWRQGINWLLPKPQEAVALLLCIFLSILPWLQIELLDQRELVQAWYRQITHQELNLASDLALVRIDDASIQKDRQGEQIMGGSAFPISQQYIGKLTSALVSQNVGAIGIDYVIDDPDPRGAEHTEYLSKIIQQAVKNGSQFVFAKILNPNSNIWMQSLPKITQGSIEAPAVRAVGDNFHMPLQSNFDSSLDLPFSYWLSWLHRHQAAEDLPLPQYRLPMSELLDALTGRLSLYPMWFHAITDFSIPPEQIYREIPAWKLLEPAGSLSLPRSAIITAGGYPEAGIAQTDNGTGYLENFVPPKAMQHWYRRQPENRYRQMTGGEHLGYLFHHFLHQRFLISAPSLLMVLLAAVIGKLALTAQPTQSYSYSSASSARSRAMLYWVTGTVFYILLSLQLYVSSAAILLPIVLPITILWLYLLPEIFSLRR